MPRGRILDRRGREVAVSRSPEDGGPQEERHYPYESAFVHLVGYDDPRYGGPTGLERQHEAELRGFMDYSALVPVLRTKDLPWGQTFSPADVTLTIDADLQQQVSAILTRAARRLTDSRTARAKEKAAAVLLDVRTGEILVAASVPSFDPNGLTPETWRQIVADSADRQALFDRARFGRYPPGSSFKVITAGAALENGVEHPIECRHEIRNLRWESDRGTESREMIRDIEGAQAHGAVDLHVGLVKSCNVYFAQLGIALGAERLSEFAGRFGFEGMPETDIVGRELPEVAMGQGKLSVSPLEMARATAAIANGGVLRQVRLVRAGSASGQDQSAPDGASPRRVMQASTADALRESMREVCRTGTARGIFDDLPFAVAGKTGTAENTEGDQQPHSWFVGFAPAGDPRVAFAVVVENGGLGSAVAAPAARDILRAWQQRRHMQ
jgi:peptidoglycan glycosyltransferase